MNKILSLLSLIGLFFIAGCSKDAVVLTEAEQLAKDTQAIDDYLASNNITAAKDASGFRYVVTSAGTGAKPDTYGNVNVNYVGKLLENGKTFDASSSPITLQLNRVISGWQKALPLINKGSKVTLYLPSGLAYGTAENGSIPGNSNLLFDIELLDDAPQLVKDGVTINKYLDSLKITTIKDPSGLQYNITVNGSGAKPSLTSTVYFTYSAKTMEGDRVFGQSSQLVSTYIALTSPPGLITGFQLLPVGSSATFFIPSSLGFGLSDLYNSSGTLLVPANSNLIYTIQLASIQ